MGFFDITLFFVFDVVFRIPTCITVLGVTTFLFYTMNSFMMGTPLLGYWVSSTSHDIWNIEDTQMHTEDKEMWEHIFIEYLSNVYEGFAYKYDCTSYSCLVPLEVRRMCHIPWTWTHRLLWANMVDAGNWSWVLWRNKESLLTPEPSLQCHIYQFLILHNTQALGV